MDCAPKQTRRLVLTVKYNNTVKKLKELEFFKDSDALFPSLEDVDLGDILFYFQFLFTNPEDEFKTNLASILKLKSIVLNDNEFEIVHKTVFPLIQFLHTYI